MKSFARPFIIIALLVFAAGCSIVAGDRLSDDAKRTITGLTQRYLTTIVQGDEVKLADYIAWADYLGHGENRISHQEYSRQLGRLIEEYPPTNPKHPLVGLRLTRISGSENDATVTLEKADGSLKEPVWIKYIWTGSGWIVLEDSLFGKDKLFARMFPERQNSGDGRNSPPIILPE